MFVYLCEYTYMYVSFSVGFSFLVGNPPSSASPAPPAVLPPSSLRPSACVSQLVCKIFGGLVCMAGAIFMFVSLPPMRGHLNEPEPCVKLICVKAFSGHAPVCKGCPA